MGHRLSKIYTRTGDDGTTGLGDGSRVAKDSRRVESYGTVDELNSAIGVVLAQSCVPEDMRKQLEIIQHRLFDLGGELCIPQSRVINDDHVTTLERWLDGYNEHLPPLKEFILPAGGMAASCCHVARTICRRAERVTVSLCGIEEINPNAVKFLNRLSDLLFVYARVLARIENKEEVLWNHEK